MRFTIDTDLKQIQLEKQISVGDLQDLLKMLGAALKDIGQYVVAVKQLESNPVYIPWYVPAQPYVPYDNWKYSEPYKITWISSDNITYQTGGTSEKHDGVPCNTSFVGLEQIQGSSSFTVCMNQ